MNRAATSASPTTSQDDSGRRRHSASRMSLAVPRIAQSPFECSRATAKPSSVSLHRPLPRHVAAMQVNRPADRGGAFGNIAHEVRQELVDSVAGQRGLDRIGHSCCLGRVPQVHCGLMSHSTNHESRGLVVRPRPHRHRRIHLRHRLQQVGAALPIHRRRGPRRPGASGVRNPPRWCDVR